MPVTTQKIFGISLPNKIYSIATNYIGKIYKIEYESETPPTVFKPYPLWGATGIYNLGNTIIQSNNTTGIKVLFRDSFNTIIHDLTK